MSMYYPAHCDWRHEWNFERIHEMITLRSSRRTCFSASRREHNKTIRSKFELGWLKTKHVARFLPHETRRGSRRFVYKHAYVRAISGHTRLGPCARPIHNTRRRLHLSDREIHTHFSCRDKRTSQRGTRDQRLARKGRDYRCVPIFTVSITNI